MDSATVPLAPRFLDVWFTHFPLRSACRRTVPDVTTLPLTGLMYLAVTLTVAPDLTFFVENLVVTTGFTFAEAAAAVMGVTVAALAGELATSCPAQRQRPRDSAMVPAPRIRRPRLELCSCTVEISLRHACEVSCRVRAGRLARSPFG